MTVSAQAVCAHNGTAELEGTANHRVKIDGQPIVNPTEPFPILPNCTMQIPPPAGPGPTPCIQGEWVGPFATRVKSNQLPVLIQTDQGTVIAATPPAPPGVPVMIENAGQTKVMAQ